jgi:ribosomal protein S27E
MKYVGIIVSKTPQGNVPFTREFEDIDHFVDWAKQFDSVLWGKIMITETGEKVGQLRAIESLEDLINMDLPPEVQIEVLSAIAESFGLSVNEQTDPPIAGYHNHYKCPKCTELWSVYSAKKCTADCPKCDTKRVFPANSTECNLLEVPAGSTIID